jgi:hypothetical protein
MDARPVRDEKPFRVEPTEDRTMQLLGIRWANRKAPPDRVQELIALERADGGWGQINDLPSNAYALWPANSR